MNVRLILIVILMLGALGVRGYQGYQVDAKARESRYPPVALERIPHDLGPWHGADAELDPIIARGTGSTDQLYRTYTDERTGVRLDAILLYGPPSEMFIHAPELCYPSAGYQAIKPMRERKIPSAGRDDPLTFRTLVFAKGAGGSTDTQEIYYAWRLGGRWVLDPGVFKVFQRISGMYKVQIARSIRPNELSGPDLKDGEGGNPCEDFLSRLLPELERIHPGAK